MSGAMAELAALNAGRPGADLIKNDDGRVRGCFTNVIHLLRTASEFRGLLGFDSFAFRAMALRSPPWRPEQCKPEPWTDYDDSRLLEWLERRGVFVRVQIAGRAAATVARENAYHPVRDYLASLQWDGVRRLDTWLSTYLGCPDTEYVQAVGSRWLISAVARVRNPGEKADCLLILEGPQGSFKSTALRILGGAWFSDNLAELSSKDAALGTRGNWIIEMSELDSLSRAEVTRAKSFISRQVDKVRPPYAEHHVELPRECVFAGSTNETGYLRDPTGGRRYWPVTVGRIDLTALAHDRDQLWAEAVHRHDEGFVWYLDTERLNRLAAEEADERYAGDEWEALIARYITHAPRARYDRWGNPVGTTPPDEWAPRPAPLDSVAVGEVLCEAIGIDGSARWSQADQSRAARCLRAMGWTRRRVGNRAARAWRYFPPAAAGVPVPPVSQYGNPNWDTESPAKSTPCPSVPVGPVDSSHTCAPARARTTSNCPQTGTPQPNHLSSQDNPCPTTKVVTGTRDDKSLIDKENPCPSPDVHTGTWGREPGHRQDADAEFLERAAIAEFEGGLAREDAEALARGERGETR